MKHALLPVLLMAAPALFAQQSLTDSMYGQIPVLPEVLLCNQPEAFADSRNIIHTMLDKLAEEINTSKEEGKLVREKAYLKLQATFPSDDELKKTEKLTDAEQQAFWADVEARQSQTDHAIAQNHLRIKDEKLRLSLQLDSYHQQLLELTEKFSEVKYKALKIKSDQRQDVYITCCNSNHNLTDEGRQQLEKIKREYCEVVSSAMLQKLTFQYNNLRDIVFIHERLTVFELMESSLLSEEEICQQNAPLIYQSGLVILSEFLTDYLELYDVLPGEADN